MAENVKFIKLRVNLTRDAAPVLEYRNLRERVDVPLSTTDDEKLASNITFARFLQLVPSDGVVVCVLPGWEFLGPSRSGYLFRHDATTPISADRAAEIIAGAGINETDKFSIEMAAALAQKHSGKIHFIYYGDEITEDYVAAFCFAFVLNPVNTVTQFSPFPPLSGTAESLNSVAAVYGLDFSQPTWRYLAGNIWICPFTSRQFIHVPNSRVITDYGEREIYTQFINAWQYYRAGGKFAVDVRLPGMDNCADCAGLSQLLSTGIQIGHPRIHKGRNSAPPSPTSPPSPRSPSGPTTHTYNEAVTNIVNSAKRSLLPESIGNYEILVRKLYGKPAISVPVTIQDVGKFNSTNLVIKYQDAKLLQPQLHCGQVKLCVSEIQFLTSLDPEKDAFCIYAGAAPSNKGAYLASLFKRVKFLLVDPKPFDIRHCDGIHVQNLRPAGTPATIAGIVAAAFASYSGNILSVNTLFTQEMATALRTILSGKHVVFISDIRTNHSVEDGKARNIPTAGDVITNNAQMMGWVKLLAPAASMLKFRHPFYDDDYMEKLRTNTFYATELEAAKRVTGIDFVENARNRRTVMYKGEYYLQAYSKKTSSESRLVIGPNLIEDSPFTYEEYDARMFTFNVCYRPFYFRKYWKGERKGYPWNCDGCVDCNIVMSVMTNYTNKYGGNPAKLWKKLLSILDNRKLQPIGHPHGDRTHNEFKFEYLMEMLAQVDQETMDVRKYRESHSPRKTT